MKSKMKNKFLTVVVAIVAMLGLMPLSTKGATEETTNRAPSISFKQIGGEVVKQSKDLISDKNKNGYGLVEVTAKDLDNDGIAYIEYVWDYDLEPKKITTLTYHQMIASRTEELEVPQTEGLHILNICAIDQKGKRSEWNKMPYYIVNQKSQTSDTTPPLLDQSKKEELPACFETINAGRDITVRFTDNESGIYYICYAWTKTSEAKPTLSDYEMVTQPKDGVVTFKAPTELGNWSLRVFAANSTVDEKYTTENTKYFMTSNIIRFDYRIEDLESPTVTVKGEEIIEIPENGTYVDEGAKVTDNCDAEKVIYANKEGLNVVGENTYKFTTRGTYTLNYKTTDENGNESNTATRTIKVIGENEIINLNRPNKNIYNYGEELDLTGAFIKVTSIEGEVRDVFVTKDMFTNFDTNRLGSYTAKFTYEGQTISYSYRVIDYVKELTIVNPKTEYDYKEELNLSRATVQKVMASGANTIAVPLTEDMLDENFVFDSNVLGEKIINVNYAGVNASFKVMVKDLSAPVITFANGTENEGINEVEIPIDTAIDLNDYTVTDNYDDENGILVEVVITSNNININKAGTYTVVYEAADSNGNTVSKTRKVTVTIDKTELDELNESIKDLVKEDYTDDSWKALEDAKNLPDDTTKDLQDKIDSINNAVQNLVKADLDTTEFDKVREQIKELITHKEDYTGESWKNLENKFNDANKAKETGLQSKLDSAVEVLKQAITDLVANPVNQDAIKPIEENLANNYKESDYTEESWKAVQDAINAAKEITDLQSKFDKAVEAIDIDTTLVAKEIDSSALDAIETEFNKLNKEEYTQNSVKAVEDAIANAKAQTLQSKFDEEVAKIDLGSLVLMPVISNPQITTSNANKGFAKVDDIVTITFESNVELDLESTSAKLNNTTSKVTKVEDEENKYQASFKMYDGYNQKELRYSITSVETREGAESTYSNEKSGIIFDMTAPIVDFANDSEGNKIGNKILEVKTEYAVGKEDIIASDNYTESKDLKVEVTTDLDVNVVNEADKTYTATYKVTDLAGNETVITRTIKVVDTTKPVITLNGEKVVILEVGDEYTEEGATVTDNYDTEIQNKLVIGGTIDVNTADTYTITYNVTDGNGNIADEVTRTVRVLDKTALKEVLDQAGKLVEDDYVPEAWKELEDAKNLPETTQDEVDAKKQAIENAIANLDKAESKEELDTTEFDKVREEIRKLVSSDYTSESWNNLKAKITEGYNAKDIGLQSKLDSAVAQIKQAVKDLVAKEVNQDGIKAVEENLTNNYKESDYTEESWKAVQDTINAAKEITDLQSKFDKAVEAIDIDSILVAKDIDTSALDVIEADFNNLNKEGYTQNSVKVVEDAIANAKAQTLQSKFDEEVEKIDLGVLVLIPTINNIQIFTSNENKGYAKVGDTITVTFESNTELNLETTKVTLNSTEIAVSKVEGEENKYQATFTMNDKCKQGNIRYGILAVETREAAQKEEKGKSGIIFDMTAPTVEFANDSEGNKIGDKTLEVKTEYVVGKEDITVSDNYTTAEDLKVEVTTDLDVNTVNEVDTTYTATYKVTDLAGNEATLTRTIKVVDTTKPVITLNGEKVVILEVGDEYTEEGATVTDNYDTEIQNKLVIGGTIDVNTADTYTITYNVTDGNGNVADEVTRTVRVLDKTALKEALDQAGKLVETDYTEESWAKLEDAKNLPETTQEEVNTKKDTIIDVITNQLVAKELDKTELNKVIAEIKKLVKTDYTEESWKNLAVKVNEAKDATLQSVLNAKVNDTKQAIKDLVAKEVNQDAIKTVEENLANNYVESDYTEESWKVINDAINAAKEIKDLQSKFDKAVDEIDIDATLVAKGIDTSALDAIVAELNKLNKEEYTESSWKNVGKLIAEARKQTLQSKFDEAVEKIDLSSLVLLPVVSDVTVETSNESKDYAKVEDTVKVVFTSNVALDLELTEANLNSTPVKVTKVEGEENKYQASFKMDNGCIEGNIRYSIKAVEDREKAEVEANGKTGIIFDMTAPVVDFANDSEGNKIGDKTLEVKTEYAVTKEDITVSDNYTTAEDLKVEVTTDLDVNTVNEAEATYTATYKVTDLAGNETVITRTIKVVDTTKPVITLVGDKVVLLELNQEEAYVDSGATALDNYDGDITANIVTVNPVDITKADTYTVTYNVTDANGNVAKEVTRTVRVLDKTGLKEVLEQAGKLVEDDYVEEAWKELEDAKNLPETTQDEVNAKKEAIENAIANLDKAESKKELDKTELNKVIAEIKKLVKTDYTEESWKNLATKLDDARSATLQSVLDAKVEDTKQAIKDLVAKEVNQDAISAIEENLNNNYVESDYTEESWKAVQDAINAAKEIKDLQSKFDKAVEDIEIDTTLVAKEINTALLDAIEAEFNKLNKEEYTQNSVKAVEDAIANAKAQTLQSKFDEEVAKIDLSTLVVVPVISNPQITTSNDNKGFANVKDTITITFTTNTELKLEKADPSNEDEAITEVKLNNTVASVVKVEGEENKYQATFAMNNKYLEKELRYAITAVETREGATATYTNNNSGIIFDMTAPVVDFANDSEGNKIGDKTLEVKTEYAVSKEDITASDNYTESKDLKVEVTTDLDVNTVNEAEATYTATYKVTDLAGNETVITRTIKVVDTTKPVITLVGDKVVLLELNQEEAYVDSGAKALDNYDGDITANIVTVNPVDITKAETYTVTYNVTDANGNVAKEVTRTVRVLDKTALKDVNESLKDLKEDDYTAESWKDLEDAKNLPETTQDEVNDKKVAIENAVDALQRAELKTEEFEKVIAQISKLVKSDYTEDSWKLLKEKQTAVQNAVDTDTKLVQSKLNAEVEELKQLVKDLVANEVNQDAISAVEEDLANNYKESDYTEESWKAVQDAISAAKEIKDLQSKFDKAVEAIDIDAILVAKELDTSALDEIKSELAKLNEDEYTTSSWKAVQDQIAIVENQTLQSKFDEEVAKIDLSTLVLIPVVSDVKVTTSNANKDYAKVGDTITVEFASNVELNLEQTAVKLNGTRISITKVGDKYQGTFTMDDGCKEGNIRYSITAVETREGASVEASGKTGIIFDKTLPTITLAVAEEETVNYGSKYVPSANDVTVVEENLDRVDIISTYNSEILGEYEITYKAVDLAGNESASTVTRKVKVEDYATGITVIKPTKLVYNQNETLDVTAGVVQLVMASGAEGQTFTMENSMITGFDSTTPGTVTLTVSYNGFTANFDITILDSTKPTIILNADAEGNKNITVEVGSGYIELGAVVEDNIDKALIPEITGDVDTTKVGTYYVHYNVTDTAGNAAEEVIRTVNVVDTTKPVVIIEEPVVTIEAGQEYDVYAGIKATDNYDGDISAEQVKIVKKDLDAFKANVPGTYNLRYFVTDSNNNQSEYTTRTINVVDTTKPVITLNGEEEVTIEVGSAYTDEGATVTDNADKDIQSKLVVGNNVDTSIVADYTITYDVTDASGMVADQVTRTVHVVDTTKPVITLKGDTEVTVEVRKAEEADTYTDKGVTVTDNYDTDIESKLVVVNPVDTTVVGNYTITYNVTDANNNVAVEVTRTVHVVDTTKPTIELADKDTTHFEMIAGEDFTDPEFIISDNYDQNCKIVKEGKFDPNAEGDYTVTYYAKDSSGNKSDLGVAITIHVQAVPPVISFVVDGKDEPLSEGKVFKKASEITFDKGSAVITKKVGDKVEEIVLSGDTDEARKVTLDDGEYTIVATDKSGSKTTINFVIDSTPPVVNLMSGFYNDEVTIEFADPDDVHSAILVSGEGNPTEIKNQYNNGIKINKKGTYSLFAFDVHGNYTRVDFEIR